MYNFHARFSNSSSNRGSKIIPENRKSALPFLSSPRPNDNDHINHIGDEESRVNSPNTPNTDEHHHDHVMIKDHGFWDVLSFGICVSASNCFIDWSSGFSNGYWDFFFTSLIASFVFISLHLCIAEMVSVLPFAGGMYAFARITCSPYIGFLVGSFEVVGNIIYAAIAMIPIGSSITYITGFHQNYEPIYWFIAYSLVILIEFTGRKWFFLFLRWMALITIVLLLFYIIISIQDIHPLQYIPSQPHEMKSHLFSNGISNMFSVVPISGWYYFGIEIIPLVSDEIQNARVNVPRAIVYTLVICTVFAYLCMFFAYAQYPSFQDDTMILKVHLPLNTGFSNALGINDQYATLFSYLALYISNALFIFGYSKQLKSLGKSKLISTIFTWTLSSKDHYNEVPYISLLIGSTIGYLLLLILIIGCNMNYDSFFINQLFYSSMIGSYCTFFIMFFSYIIFQYKYNNLKRSFHNPFGIVSAVLGIIGLTFMSVGLIGFMDEEHISIVYFIGFVFIISIYYYFYARYYQIFSDEEQKIMFVVYVVKANQKKHHRITARHPKKINTFSLHPNSPMNSPISSPTNAARNSQNDQNSISLRSFASSLRSITSSHSRSEHRFIQRIHRIHVTNREERRITSDCEENEEKGVIEAPLEIADVE